MNGDYEVPEEGTLSHNQLLKNDDVQISKDVKELSDKSCEDRNSLPNQEIENEANGENNFDSKQCENGVADNDECEDTYDDSSEWTSIDEEEEDDAHLEKPKQNMAMMRKRLRRTDGIILPKTVSLIEGANGEKLYLVGTAHFSQQSCEDVKKVIAMVQPDAVMVELCQSRIQVLTLDEEELSKISDENRFDRLKKCIQQKGFLSGLVLYMMLHMSAHITKQLGMAPGSEFRAALQETRTVPGCSLYLGDRPLEITLQRMLASLTVWQKLKFGVVMLQELKPISAEDVEKMKEQDMFEQFLSELVVEYPHMVRVLVSERDMYLTGFLQQLMKQPVLLPDNVPSPPVVVGVVGIGHCNGIKARFSTDITAEEMREIQRLPPPSRFKRLIRITFKGVLFTGALYAAYKTTVWIGIQPVIASRLRLFLPAKFLD